MRLQIHRSKIPGNPDPPPSVVTVHIRHMSGPLSTKHGMVHWTFQAFQATESWVTFHVNSRRVTPVPARKILDQCTVTAREQARSRNRYSRSHGLRWRGCGFRVRQLDAVQCGLRAVQHDPTPPPLNYAHKLGVRFPPSNSRVQ